MDIIKWKLIYVCLSIYAPQSIINFPNKGLCSKECSNFQGKLSIPLRGNPTLLGEISFQRKLELSLYGRFAPSKEIKNSNEIILFKGKIFFLRKILIF